MTEEFVNVKSVMDLMLHKHKPCASNHIIYGANNAIILSMA